MQRRKRKTPYNYCQGLRRNKRWMWGDAVVGTPLSLNVDDSLNQYVSLKLSYRPKPRRGSYCPAKGLLPNWVKNSNYWANSGNICRQMPQWRYPLPQWRHPLPQWMYLLYLSGERNMALCAFPVSQVGLGPWLGQGRGFYIQTHRMARENLLHREMSSEFSSCIVV